MNKEISGETPQHKEPLSLEGIRDFLKENEEMLERIKEEQPDDPQINRMSDEIQPTLESIEWEIKYRDRTRRG